MENAIKMGEGEEEAAAFLSFQKKLPSWIELKPISFLPHEVEKNT